MAAITVTSSQTSAGWTLNVQVTDGKGKTTHTVTLTRDDFQTLTQDHKVSPEEVVRKSFEFLLEREPKEAILRQFDLSVISRYFPEYPDEIRKRL